MFLLSLITINCESMRFSLETFRLKTINTGADTRTPTAQIETKGRKTALFRAHTFLL